MNIFLNNRYFLNAIFITISTMLFTSLLFATLYTFIPIKIQILPIFANFSLGLAVFLGSFYISRKTAFFRIKNIVLLSLAINVIILFCSVFSGSITSEFILGKSIIIIVSSFIGEICGKL